MTATRRFFRRLRWWLVPAYSPEPSGGGTHQHTPQARTEPHSAPSDEQEFTQ